MKRIIPLQVASAPGSSGAPTSHALPGQPTAPPPLSLYVHLPWCVQKCPYCDFNSHAAGGEIPEDAYVDALVADLEAALPLVWGRTVASVFFGGGTPSLFSVAAIDRLLSAIRMRLPLQAGAEITLEANPGTVEAAKFKGLRAAGVTRLSLGVQSFNPRHLQALGRIHDADEARRAAGLAIEHFPAVNFDLMYGLPQQTLAEALDDVETALSFGPGHLSCYQLTIEPNTPFAALPPERLQTPEADVCADMQDAIEERLAQAGFQHYETSAFARPGQRCQHNLNYWTFGDYLGIGAGAHGKLTLHDRILRQVRHKSPKAYLASLAGVDDGGRPNAFLQSETTVEAADLPFEFMMNALRLIDGVPAALYEERTRLPLIGVAAQLAEARRAGLLDEDPRRLQATVRGRHFLNPLLQGFLPDR
jgi:putative oxygen-independent coproporphyrinogen III oxidase